MQPDLTEERDVPPVLTDDELCALALGADLDGPTDGEAVPMDEYLAARGTHAGGGLLPTWYMPTPMSRIRPRWRTAVVLAIVAAFVLIEAAGLCSTFGQIVPA
jgi:hypothetical protein